jgi:Tol biopolymer transport system component
MEQWGSSHRSPVSRAKQVLRSFSRIGPMCLLGVMGLVAAMAPGSPASFSKKASVAGESTREVVTIPPIRRDRIGFASDRDGSDEIYTMNADGTDPRRRTINAAWDSQPAFSPDGERIAFVSDRDGNAEIYVMNTDGSHPTNLTNDAGDDLEPVFSPDGKQIAFSSYRGEGWKIYVVNADGSGEPEQLTFGGRADSNPAFSPSGKQIAFDSGEDSGANIYLMDAGGSDPRPLTETGQDHDPVFSPSGERIAFTSYCTGDAEIYVMSADGTGDPINITNNPAYDNSPSWGVPPSESEMGQVYKSGHLLYDDNGRWPVNGVQFFLPQHGINNWTFYDDNYRAASRDIDYWLDKASDYLLAKTLRIFVELPSDGSTPTAHSTLYDFAIRAGMRGMRLGLVLHNSADFSMTSERRDWIDGLITYFEDRRSTSLIAYVSAGNEINNQCLLPDGRRIDCFDGDQSYVDQAVDWVSVFNDIFKSRGSSILVTVGLSTEVEDIDDEPATKDFFRPQSTGGLTTLADVTDFLSPHNYAGGGHSVIKQMRGFDYAGPVVLEEYGFPTDPMKQKASFTEGPSECRWNPWPDNSVCEDTAPYFIEINARSIRDTRDAPDGYAGGVAWMLADIDSKNCSSNSALYTGLFAAGLGYDCGGTTSTGPGQDKATAFRVRTHHYYYR